MSNFNNLIQFCVEISKGDAAIPRIGFESAIRGSQKDFAALEARVKELEDKSEHDRIQIEGLIAALDNEQLICRSKEAELARLKAQEPEKAIVKHYTGCKYPLLKINSLEVVVVGRREDAEDLADYINSLHSLPAEPHPAAPAKSLFEFLEWASKEVEKWPEWKQNGADVSKAIGCNPQPKPFIVKNFPTETFCPAEHEGSLLWSEIEGWNKGVESCRNSVIAAGGEIAE